MSEMGHLMHRSKFHFLFDHLVGAGKQRQRDGEAERLRNLEVDDQLDIRDLLHRKVKLNWRGSSLKGKFEGIASEHSI